MTTTIDYTAVAAEAADKAWASAFEAERATDYVGAFCAFQQSNAHAYAAFVAAGKGDWNNETSGHHRRACAATEAAGKAVMRLEAAIAVA